MGGINMVKRVFSIIVAIAVVLSTLPGNAMAAENEGAMTPTRVQSKTLTFTDEAAGNEAEGWKWTPDPVGGVRWNWRIVIYSQR